MYAAATVKASFNSQPPEGGWVIIKMLTAIASGFQLTAARRRLVMLKTQIQCFFTFQLTAARRRLGVFVE